MATTDTTRSANGAAVNSKADFIVRPAKSSDCDAILSLIRGLAEYEREPDAVENTAEQLRHDGFGPQPRFISWIAETTSTDKPSAVGFALCYYAYSTWTGTCLFLEDIYVIPEQRGCGVGMSLITTCIQYAAEQNLARVQWSALDWNTPALDFYQRIGAIQTREWVAHRMTRPIIQAFVAKYKDKYQRNGLATSTSSTSTSTSI